VRGGWGEPTLLLDRAPGMGADLGVEVPHGGGSTEPLAEGKGVSARWGLEEAGGKAAS
jgi:hypothetical protein